MLRGKLIRPRPGVLGNVRKDIGQLNANPHPGACIGNGERNPKLQIRDPTAEATR